LSERRREASLRDSVLSAGLVSLQFDDLDDHIGGKERA